ncbi:hypothetical protein C8R45DRAFT_604867 [Mycena sanguinolenta]|nr:hypothetical protein C8R45DRAFT_604867 [Mycena sanguinolenta]
MSPSDSAHEGETEVILEKLCASARISLQNPSCTLESMDPSAISHYLVALKKYWRPEDDTLEIPKEWGHVIEPSVEEPSLVPQSFALSLLSATLSYIRTALRLVPTSDFIARFKSPNYRGPQFPLEDRRINVVALFDLLVCDGSSTEGLRCLACCFSQTPGCRLKMYPVFLNSTVFLITVPAAHKYPSRLSYALNLRQSISRALRSGIALATACTSALESPLSVCLRLLLFSEFSSRNLGTMMVSLPTS